MIRSLIGGPSPGIGTISGLTSSQMPTVSGGTTITGTTYDVDDDDAGLVQECTNAAGCTVDFQDTTSAGSSGGFFIESGAGVIDWAVSGSMVVTVVSSLAGATATKAAPSYLFWHCYDTNKINVWGDLE